MLEIIQIKPSCVAFLQHSDHPACYPTFADEDFDSPQNATFDFVHGTVDLSLSTVTVPDGLINDPWTHNSTEDGRVVQLTFFHLHQIVLLLAG